MNLELPQEVNIKSVLAIRKYLYLPAMTATVVVVLLTAVITPNIRRISLLRKEVKLAKEQMAGLEEKSSFLASIDEPQLQDQLIILERILPADKDVFGLLVSLNGLAVDTGVALGNFKTVPGSIATESATPSARPEEGEPDVSQRQDAARKQVDLDTLGVSFDLVGPFGDISNFILNLERLKPLMKLNILSIVPSKARSEASTADRVAAKIELSLFYAPLPEQLGAVGSPIVPLSEVELTLFDELSTYSAYEITVPTSLQIGREDPFAPF